MAYVAPQATYRSKRDEEDQNKPNYGTASNIGGANVGKQALNKEGVESARSNTATGQGAQRQSPEAFTKTNFSSASTILDRNRQANQDAVTGALTKDAQAQTTQALGSMDQRAQDYTQQQEARKTGNPTQDQLNSAISGKGANDFATTQGFLTQGPIQAGQFDAGTYDPIQATEYLRSGDITPLLQQKRSGQGAYTQGMAGLDAAAFGRSGGYEKVGQQLGSLQNQVAERQAALTDQSTGLQATTQKTLSDWLNQAQQGVKDYLGGQQGNIYGELDKTLRSQQGNIDKTLDTIIGQRTGEFNKQIDDNIASLKARASDPMENAAALQDAITRLSSMKDTGVGNYLNVNQPRLTRDNVVTGDQATSLGLLNQLLGGGGQLPTPSGMPEGPSAALNQGGIDAALAQILTGANASATTRDAMKLEKEKAAQAAAAAQAQQAESRVMSTVPGGIASAPTAVPKTVNQATNAAMQPVASTLGYTPMPTAQSQAQAKKDAGSGDAILRMLGGITPTNQKKRTQSIGSFV